MTIAQAACPPLDEPVRAERTVGGLHAFLLDEVASHVRKDARVLDVGCGTGAWLLRLRNAGYSQLRGIDLDDTAASLSGLGFNEIDLERADWQLEGDTFDLITVIEVIEHIGNRTNFLRNLHQHLCSDGLVLMTTPNVHNFRSKLRFLLSDRLHHFNEYADRTHYQPVILYPFELLLQREGFQITGLKSYSPAGASRLSRGPTRYFLERAGALLSNTLPGEILLISLAKAPA
jgi:SAM-dependent methyltransferase